MNYYDEILNKIYLLIENKEYDEAKRLILNELDVSYVPRDFEDKLKQLLTDVNYITYKQESLDEDTIRKYLFLDEKHQLLAVDQLNKLNLRDYIDLCNEYLKSNGFKDAKALLVDSLIRQNIDYKFNYIDDNRNIIFNPSLFSITEESDAFLSCFKQLSERFMKEPSMLQMAKQLLYKELLLALPEVIEENEYDLLVNKLEKYIRDAFK